MKRSLPIVSSYPNQEEAKIFVWEKEERKLVEISLDSPAWSAWLEREQSFRFVYRKTGSQPINITIRPEKRGERTYWQAWKTMQGQTRKKYIAASAKVSKAKLDEIGEWFWKRVQENDEKDQEMVFFSMVVDLVWLVEQLLSQGRQPGLVRQARRDLKQIKASFGNSNNYQTPLRDRLERS